MGNATAAPEVESAAPVVQLTVEELDALVQRIREEAIQAVLTATSGSEPDTEPEAPKVAKRALDVSDADKVLRLKSSKPLIKYTAGKPLGWAYGKLRRGVAAFGDLSPEASKRIFSGSLTRIQAVAARDALENGRPVVIDGITINPR